MNITVNNDLQNFLAFAKKANADQTAGMTQNGSVGNAEKSAGAVSRFFHATENSRAAVETNNHVREALVNALKRQFNVLDFTALPDTVKTALIGTHAKTADGDFAFDTNGRVTSGKPLTARRILAVMTAIEGIQKSKAEALQNVPVTEATVNARRDALAPYLDRLAQKVLAVPAGFKVPILSERFAVPLKETLKRHFKGFLAEVGTNKKKTLEMALRKFNFFVEGSGVIPMYWMGGIYADDDGDPKPGQVGRARVLEDFLNELVREFNADHPELALQ